MNIRRETTELDTDLQKSIKLEDKNMRILKGYSKAQQKELEYAKKI